MLCFYAFYVPKIMLNNLIHSRVWLNCDSCTFTVVAVRSTMLTMEGQSGDYLVHVECESDHHRLLWRECFHY